jgi:hypothetical protein
MTQCNALLSMVRVFGMTVAPALNGLLAIVNFEISIGDKTLTIDPLNSVGLFLVLANLVSLVVIYVMLEEPSEDKMPSERDDSLDEERSWNFWKNVLRVDILLPFLSLFALNANFMLMETGMAPVRSHHHLSSLSYGSKNLTVLFVGGT